MNPGPRPCASRGPSNCPDHPGATSLSAANPPTSSSGEPEVADSIRAAGGKAFAARVDARDSQSVANHAANVVAEAGSIDISVNAVSLDEVQGIPLVDLTLEDYVTPILAAAEAHFLTARTAAKQMISQGSGVIVLMSSSAAKETRHDMGGFSVACAGIEALARSLAGEVGRQGVRVIAVRPNLIPEAAPNMTDDDLAPLRRDTVSGQLPQLDDVATTIAFVSSDAAAAMTGSVLNLTCGAILD